MTPHGKTRTRLMLWICASFLALLAGANTRGQTVEPFKFFREYVGLNDEQIAAIRNGKAIAKIVESRTPDEVIVFGAVYVESTADKYLKFASDIDSLRKLPNYGGGAVSSSDSGQAGPVSPELSTRTEIRLEKE